MPGAQLPTEAALCLSFQTGRHSVRRAVAVLAAEGKLRCVATDGHRLAFTAATLDVAVPTKQEVILPRKTVLELQP